MNLKNIKLGIVLFGLVLGMGGGMGTNINASGFEATLDSLNSQNFPFIFLNVRVADNGTAITDLTADNFQCSENGTTQTDFFQVTPPETSGGVRLADVVFLIDTSGSMGSAITEVKNNVNAFADALAISDVDYRLGLVQFGQYSNSGYPQLFNSGNLTDNADQFKGFVDTLSATGGYEPGFLALRMAAQGFNFRPGAQKVFLLISDEDSDDRDKEGTITLMQTNDVVVHTAVNCSYGSSSSDYCDDTSVRAATGGQLFSVQGPYNEILDSIVEQTASAYIIRYKSSNPNFDGTQRNVECIITRDTDQTTILGSYIPGSAPSIALSPQTEELNQNTLPENSPDAIIRVSVIDEVWPFVQLNGVRLYYRTSGSNSDYSSVIMNLSFLYYEATIPVVSPPGIDYYITATDGEQTSSLPSTDPSIYSFQIAVLPNVAPEIDHEPITSTGKDQLITIIATITDTTDSLVETILKYRRVGELIYKTTEMQNIGGDVFEAVIPADEVTEDIEYYLIAKDNFGVASFEATADEPFVIDIEEVTSDLDFRPSIDGFKFKNFCTKYFDVGLNENVSRTWEMFEQFFGTNATMMGSARQYSAEEFFKDQYGKYEAENCGSCNGFSATSLLNFKRLDQPNAGSFAMSHHEILFLQDFNDKIKNAIAYQQGFFFSAKTSWYLTDLMEESNNSPKFFYKKIKDGIQNKEPIVLWIWEKEDPEWWEIWKEEKNSGHALVPYRYEEDSSENKAYVFVYDSNNPGDDNRKVTFNFNDDSWSYEIRKGWWFLGEIWDGNVNDSHITISTIPLPMYLDKGIAPWSQEVSPFAYICSVGEITSPLFSNQEGNQIGYTEDGFVNDFPGANYLVSPTQTQDQTTGYYYLPEDNNYSVALRGNDEGTADFSLFGNRLLIKITDATVHSSTVDNINVGRGKKSLTYSTNDNYKEYSATIAEELPGTSRIVMVDTNISAGDLTTLEITDEQSFKYVNTGGAKKYNLLLEQRGAGIGKISFTGLVIKANETHIVDVAEWDDLANTVINVKVDYNSDGVIDEIQRLQFVPKQLKIEVVEKLEEVKTGDNKIDKKINDVIEYITKSLQDNLWQDEISLDPEKGKKVFAYEMVAVTKMKLYLNKPLNHRELPENIIVAFKQAMKDLVVVDKMLAKNILEKAKNTPVQNSKKQNSFDKMIENAEKELTKAEEDLENDKPAKAILEFGSSWHFSQKAIKIAGE